MSECDHIIGEASGEGEDYHWHSWLLRQSEIEARQGEEFEPFKHCPECGADVSHLSADLEATLAAKREAERRKWEEDRPRRESAERRHLAEMERERIAENTPPEDPVERWAWEIKRAARNSNPFAGAVTQAWSV